MTHPEDDSGKPTGGSASARNHPHMPREAATAEPDEARGQAADAPSFPPPPSSSAKTHPARMVFLPCECGTIHEMPDPEHHVRFRCKTSGTLLEYHCHHIDGHALLGTEGTIPLHGDSLRVGRDPACEIPVPQGHLSRNHCRLSFRDRAYWIEDLGSTHGTHVNEVRLAKDTPRRLAGGDLIRIADLFFRYVVPTPPGGAPGTESALSVCPLEDETCIAPEPGSVPARAGWTENETVVGDGDQVPGVSEPVDELLGKDLGAFHVRSVLDQGGMGRVYRGTENATDRECVVKTMIPDRTPTLALVDRFRREIELSARLAHPNIIAFLGMGQYGDILYFASEYFEGRDLKCWYEDAPATLQDALRIGIQASHALQEAHAHGVIHRDIKPDNILRSREGVVKVIDFGIAKMLDDPAYSALTMSGAAIGTPKYMAPEQMRGQRNRIGPPADVYGLAATLYFCLTSRTPRKGNSIMEIFLTISQPPDSISALRPDVPPEMDAILRKALAPEPEDRYPDMEAFRRALETLCPT